MINCFMKFQCGRGNEYEKFCPESLVLIYMCILSYLYIFLKLHLRLVLCTHFLYNYLYFPVCNTLVHCLPTGVGHYLFSYVNKD